MDRNRLDVATDFKTLKRKISPNFTFAMELVIKYDFKKKFVSINSFECEENCVFYNNQK